MQRSLISIILFSIPNLLLCQSTQFSSKYNPFFTETISRSIIIIDSSYYIGNAGIDESTGRQQLGVLGIDKYGIPFFFKQFGDVQQNNYPGTASSFQRLPTGNYIWAGGRQNSIRVSSFLMMINTNFDLIWEKNFAVNTDTVYSFLDILNVCQTLDQGFALIGEVKVAGVSNLDILLIKTDSLGEKLWQKTYNFKGLDCGWNLIETPDKGFLLCAGGYVAGNDQSYDGLIIKTDSAGNEQWRKVIGGPYLDYYCVVANSNDGNFIVGTVLADSQITPEASISRIRLMKVSQTGAVIWVKLYGKNARRNSVGQLLITQNDDIVISGNYRPKLLAQGDSWGWILKTNSQGDSLWMREYYYFNGDANANRLYDIKQTPDGGFIACGEVDSLPAIPESIWVLKLDSFGCLVPGCQNVGMKEVILQDTEQVVIFPNPASKEVNIRLPENFGKNAQQARLFDHLGREVLRQPLTAGEATHTLNIASLPAGIYYIRVIGNGISVVAGKVVKE